MPKILRSLFIQSLVTLVATGVLRPVPCTAEGSGSLDFQTCYARWSNTELVLGNAHVKRVWRIRDGLLTATSLHDLDSDTQWLAKPAARPAPYPAAAVPDERRQVTITAQGGRASPVEAESLVVTMVATGRTTLNYRFQIFPHARGVAIQFAADGIAAGAAPVARKETAATATGIELAKAAMAADAGDSLEDLELAPTHLRFTQATLLDQTDNHNELVFEKEWLLMMNEAPLQLPGNVFFVENSLTGAGLLFLKQAPLPHARPQKSDWDALVVAGKRRVRFSGQGYPFVLLAYAGGRSGRIEALQTYQRQVRSYDPARDGMLLSNTWGDRSRDARINEAFILKEIEAGARLGVDVVQIDDGWQKGRTANSARGKGVWNGYWATDPLFWQPDPQRFPHGLEPLVQAARRQGMKFGLWFGPDSSHDAANWNRDAAKILELHRTQGIDYFKIDSVKATTTAAETNLQRFFGRVLQESAGRVVFDLDVTAEIRPGYFGAMGAGPIFVENRYSDFHRYWPHQTLRNLWMLAQYVDPLRLRMEFLNNTRNVQLYPDDPLAPVRYGPDCLFAITMFANPLGWFEVSNLPEEYVASVSKLVRIWKRERSTLFGGSILPIGSSPDGMAWTGFASVAPDRRGGYGLFFRELNKSPDFQIDLSLFAPGAYAVDVLAGSGTARVDAGKLSVRIPEPLQYLWIRLRATDAIRSTTLSTR
jgi:alpha-galactosidase